MSKDCVNVLADHPPTEKSLDVCSEDEIDASAEEDDNTG